MFIRDDMSFGEYHLSPYFSKLFGKCDTILFTDFIRSCNGFLVHIEITSNENGKGLYPISFERFSLSKSRSN